MKDPDLTENRDRVINKDKFLPQVKAAFKALTQDELMKKIETLGLPFAPIGKPEDMFDDVHLNAGDGLIDMEMENGERCKLPALPISLDGERLGLSLDPPKAGEHTDEILSQLGFDLVSLKSGGVI